MSNIKIRMGIELGKQESINSVNRTTIKNAFNKGNYQLEGIILLKYA